MYTTKFYIIYLNFLLQRIQTDREEGRLTIHLPYPIGRGLIIKRLLPIAKTITLNAVEYDQLRKEESRELTRWLNKLRRPTDNRDSSSSSS